MDQVEKVPRPKLTFLESSLVVLRQQCQVSVLFSEQQIHQQETKAKVKVDHEYHHHH